MGEPQIKLKVIIKHLRVFYALGPLYFRKDRVTQISTKLRKIEIKKNFGWCDDVKSKFLQQTY